MKIKRKKRLRKLALGLCMVMSFTSIYVSKDGIIRAEENDTVIVGTQDPGYEEFGEWDTGGLTGYNGERTRFSFTPGAYATWSPELESGAYEVSIYKIVHSSSDRFAKIDVVYAGGTDTQFLDYTQGESGWVTLGVYYFDSESPGYVRNSRSADAIRADAVRFEKVENPTTAVVSSPASFTDVPVDTIIEIIFNNSMNTDTVNDGTVKVNESNTSTQIEAEYRLSDDCKELVIQPTQELQYDTEYTIIISDDARDVNNQRVYGVRSWSFATESEPPEHEYEELLENGGFEDGLGDWFPRPEEVAIAITEDAENVNSGERACLLTSRTAAHSSPTLDVTDIFRTYGQGNYVLSASVKTASSADNLMVVLEVTTSEKRSWFTTAPTAVNSSGYTRITAEKTVYWDGELESVNLYVQSNLNTDLLPGIDLYLDDFSLARPKDQTDPPLPMPDISLRNEQTLVGAIRWDAWVGDADTGNTAPVLEDGFYVGQQVERSLTPVQYHDRLPWFSVIQEDGSVKIDGLKQAIVDREIRYAKAAGIDYFAYCYYDYAMAEPRKMHLDSLERNGIKWCYILGGPFNNPSFSDQAKLDEVLNEMNSPLYQKTTDGRPIIYLFEGIQPTAAERFINAWEEGKLDNPPYIVAMGGNLAANDLIETRGDAFSWYTYAGQNGAAYQTIIDGQLTLYNRQKDYGENGAQVVPVVSSGWDKRPRHDNPVSWELSGAEGFKNQWVQQPTNEELARSLEQAIEWNEANKKNTVFNSVIIYAWNEFDEGGWISPTLFELRDSGSPVRLDVIRDVLIRHRVDYTDIGSVPWASDAINGLAVSHVFDNIAGTSFEPSREITRAEFLYYLIGTFGLYAEADGNFDDIEETAFYYTAAAIAKTLQLVSSDNNMLYPEEILDNQQMLDIISRTLSVLDIGDDHYAEETLKSEFDRVGLENYFDEESDVTRAEAALALYHLLISDPPAEMETETIYP